jgi:hypothetical protein
MKRLLGWLFNAAAAVSFVALIAVAALWAFSYAALEPVALRAGGRVWFTSTTVDFDFTPTFLNWYSPREELWRGLGLIVSRDAGGHHELSVSMVHLVAALAVLPFFWGVHRIEAKRWGPGLCPGCGYYMRGRYGACPECGASVTGPKRAV